MPTSISEKLYKTTYAQDVRELCKRNKLCVRCREKDAYTMAGRFYCYECSEKNKEILRAYYAKNKQKYYEYNKNRAEKLAENKLCPRCGKPNKSKFKTCEMCRAQKRAAYHQKKEIKIEICLWCDNKPVEGKYFCAECLEKKRAIFKKAMSCRDNKNHPWRFN